jgi:uncharacterized protein (DUF58 family)
VEKFIPSQNGMKHVLFIIDCILSIRPAHNGTHIARALEYLNRVEKKRSVVFLISDFLDEGYERELKIAASRHDLIRVKVADRAEELIPSGAIFTFTDLETGEVRVIDAMKTKQEITPVGGLTRRNLIPLYTGEDYVRPLKRFFKRRGAL